MGNFLLSSVGPRLPLVASVVAHAAIVVAATTAGGAGHGKGITPSHVAERTIEVEAPVPPPLAELPPAADVPSHADHAHTHATHTHPYPLPPDHDDIPHDPSIDHRHPASAPAVQAAEAPALPTFSIVLGAADVAPVGITSSADVHEGSGRAPQTSAADTQAEEDESAVSVPARLVSSVRPQYPASARASGLEADVALEIVLDASGRVVESRVLRPAGHGFDESALSAIRLARFTPARRDGAAVRVRMPWTVSFRLE